MMIMTLIDSTLPSTEVLFFDGCDDLDAVGPLEVLVGAGFPTRLVRPPSDPMTVHSHHGLRLQVGDVLGAGPGLVVVPGGGWLDGSATGVRAQCGGDLPRLLRELHDHGTVIASVCTGALLLAAAGVLTGRPAVTNRLALADLAAAGSDVRSQARVVDDGSVVTSAGPAAGLDLAIHLVERFASRSAAVAAAERIEHVPVGPVLIGAAAA